MDLQRYRPNKPCSLINLPSPRLWPKNNLQFRQLTNPNWPSRCSETLLIVLFRHVFSSENRSVDEEPSANSTYTVPCLAHCRRRYRVVCVATSKRFKIWLVLHTLPWWLYGSPPPLPFPASSRIKVERAEEPGAADERQSPKNDDVIISTGFGPQLTFRDVCDCVCAKVCDI